jgi:hypothetical protein
MTGWRALLEYQAAGFPPGCEGFSFEQCLRIAESRIFYGFCAKGYLFSRVRLRQPRMRSRKNTVRVCKDRGIITVQAWGLKVPYLLLMIKHP